MTADEAEGARMSRTESLLPCGGVVGARPWRPAAVRRLTRLFRGAWGRIPKADRRIMVDYWDRPGYCFPLVILYDRLGTTADGKTTYAQYLAPGRFDFSHDMTADMPDEMVEAPWATSWPTAGCTPWGTTPRLSTSSRRRTPWPSAGASR